MEQAPKLRLKRRLELARELQISLDEPTLEENELLWLEVIGRQVEEIRSGKVKGTSWEEVMNDARAG